MNPLPLVVCGGAALLYALGRRGRPRPWREVSFYSGVALAFVVLERPFEDWADKWLSAHMAQHIVLMTVVPPFVVLGRPWPRMWLPFPLAARRAVGGALSRSPSFRRSAGFLKRPAVALAVQSAMVALWPKATHSATPRTGGDLSYACTKCGNQIDVGSTKHLPPARHAATASGRPSLGVTRLTIRIPHSGTS